MTSRPAVQCVYCAHWRSPLDDAEQGDVQVCAAFPAGIPDEIWDGRVDHRQAIEGDHGIRWAPRAEGVQFPAYAVDS